MNELIHKTHCCMHCLHRDV